MSHANAPKCPKCGESDCRRVRLRGAVGWAVGFGLLGLTMAASWGVLLLLSALVSRGWAEALLVPVFFAVLAGVLALGRYLFEIRWHCPACTADFRYDAANRRRRPVITSRGLWPSPSAPWRFGRASRG